MENVQSSAEYNNGELVDDHEIIIQETAETAIGVEELSQLLASRYSRGECQAESWQRPQIRKVLPQLRLRLRKEQRYQVYDPVMVSLGPYHHGKPELCRAEGFKHVCLDRCAENDEQKKVLFYNKIMEKIAEIRECFAEVRIVEKYNNEELAIMMLLDACFIISYMRLCTAENMNAWHWIYYLGSACWTFVTQDILLLENQIPFQVLKLLITLQCDKREDEEGFFPKFLSNSFGTDLENAKIPQETEKPPIHFLEAYWRVATRIDMNTKESERRVHPIRRLLASKFCRWPTPFSMAKPGLPTTKKKNVYLRYARRSATELKAKGIRFRRSCDYPSFMNITFTSSAFNGELRIPNFAVSDLNPVFYSNFIAYEVTSNGESLVPAVVLSYVIFLKSLIQSTEDVKELQEKGILLNKFDNLEKVVEVFKEIDTFGLVAPDYFEDVKSQIEEHCNSKAKTWIADLIHTRFQTPWTAIALFAAVFLLCLTFLQTLYTIRPVK